MEKKEVKLTDRQRDALAWCVRFALSNIDELGGEGPKRVLLERLKKILETDEKH